MYGAGVHRAKEPRFSPIWVVLLCGAVTGLIGIGTYHIASKMPVPPKMPVAPSPFNDFVVPSERESSLPSFPAVPPTHKEPTLIPSALPLVVLPSKLVPSIIPPSTISPSPSVDPYMVVTSTAPFIGGSE